MALTWVMITSGNAQEASPAPGILPVPQQACTVEPRSLDELRRLVERGIRDYVAGATPMPIALGTTDAGQPTDTATEAAVTATIREFTACSNAGDLPAMAALATDELMSRPLGRVAIFAGHVFAGGTGTPLPAETPSAGALDAYLISLQVRQPLPRASWAAVLEIRDVRRLVDGRVRATVVTVSQDAPTPVTDTIFLQPGPDRYLVEGAVRSEAAVVVPATVTPIP